MISNNNSVANAVGGKTARACDSCIKKRAKWYCAADDAFLCQSCDSSVHSANSLARRHERVRLKTASLKNLDLGSKKLNSLPSWHKGFTRKARTPRHNKGLSQSKLEEVIRNPIPLVPEVGSDEVSHEENCEEEQLLYRVPIFEPFVAELCNPSTPLSSNEGGVTTTPTTTTPGNESKRSLTASNGVVHDGDSLHGLLPSDMDLADFAANVESLLGKGLESESFGMEELGLVDCKEEEAYEREYCLGSAEKVRLEEDDEESSKELKKEYNDDIDMAREPPFELSFDYDSPVSCGEGDENVVYNEEKGLKNNDYENTKRKKILLHLDYEAVITAWTSSQGCCPWTNGERPDFDPDECWSHCMGYCGGELQNSYGDGSIVGGHATMGDGGREARVSRYREKRRTRLFSKKIRYEVRKLNAEKRPRMKGRFVKRATFAGGPLLA